MKHTHLTLEFPNGKTFNCQSKIYNSNFYGKIVFTTANIGYTESISDPSYSNQILVFSNPNIGSYGFNKQQLESTRIWPAGIILNSLTNNFSNHKAQSSLTTILKKYKVITMLSNEIREIIQEIHNTTSNVKIYCNKNITLPKVKHLASLYTATTHRCVYLKTLKPHTLIKIMIIDFGNKKSTITHLIKRKTIFITIVKAHQIYKEIKKIKPNGILISSGPGNARKLIKKIKEIKKIISKIPILGICLGHQLIAKCMGLYVFKMIKGHHGINHPIKFINCKKLFITTQNHNYCIQHTPQKNFFYSMFDYSNQGFIFKKKLIISLQGHPEATPGTNDIAYIFDKYISMIKKCQKIY
ncbi:carbamoyl phosphate synthase small subunit [Candidatus Vidania fulgoroideae]|uniref:carbamoyl-phosphate synthase (glutamine-hydrolyzing) n=1 Tax=Candidatus Vidania fulgoroideorum TaxID=881286 RepID=A0A975AEF7_9PROT|nr:carbamoyl phosphate synthase small subunit [Candidatus Vidania fulgoroideae]